MRMIVGVDLGGTSIVVGTISEDGHAVHGVDSQPTPVDAGFSGVVEKIAEMVRGSIAATRDALGTEVEIAGVGVGAPGPLDTKRGLVVLTPNLGWTNAPLRDRVAEATGLPTALDNDANCATFGEWWCGAARDARIVVGITIGTGIGGGIVLDGTIFHGASDVAGEIGHTTVDSTGRRCGCGNYGCLEAYASGPAIAARAREGLETGVTSSLPDYVTGDLTRITAQTVYDAAKDGDEFAREVVKETAKILGAGVANIINVINPEVVVIMGGVTRAGERLFVPLIAEVKRRAFRPAVEACRIVPGSLTGTAGVYGAVASFKVQQWGAV